MVCGFEPHIRLCTDSAESAWDSLSPSLSVPSPLVLSLSLSVCLSLSQKLSGLKQPFYFAYVSRILILERFNSMIRMWSLMQLQSDFDWGCSHLKAWLNWKSKMAHSLGWQLKSGCYLGLSTGTATYGLSTRLRFVIAWQLSFKRKCPESEHFKRSRQKRQDVFWTNLGSCGVSLLLYIVCY